MDNIISNVNSIYTNGTYASGTGNDGQIRLPKMEKGR